MLEVKIKQLLSARSETWIAQQFPDGVRLLQCEDGICLLTDRAASATPVWGNLQQFIKGVSLPRSSSDEERIKLEERVNNGLAKFRVRPSSSARA